MSKPQIPILHNTKDAFTSASGKSVTLTPVRSLKEQAGHTTGPARGTRSRLTTVMVIRNGGKGCTPQTGFLGPAYMRSPRCSRICGVQEGFVGQPEVVFFPAPVEVYPELGRVMPHAFT